MYRSHSPFTQVAAECAQLPCIESVCPGEKVIKIVSLKRLAGFGYKTLSFSWKLIYLDWAVAALARISQMR